ncbi:MAG TPA: hypothetical protein VF579_07500 [Candidatus Methylomirabilis sp.]
MLQFVLSLACNTANGERQSSKTFRWDETVTFGTPAVSALREKLDRSVQFDLRRIAAIEHGQPDLLLLGFLCQRKKVWAASSSRTRLLQKPPPLAE